MPALPPDRPGAPPPAPGEHAAGGPGETGPIGPGCPCPPAAPRLPTGPRPLPDPAAVRLCLIPDSAPPYDADVAAARLPGASIRSSTGPSAVHGSPPSSESGSPGMPGSAWQGPADATGSAGHGSAGHGSAVMPGSAGHGSTNAPGSAERGSAVGPGSRDRAGLPDPRKSSATPGSRGLPSSPAPPPGWPSQFAQVLAETLAGSRSPRQLVPWTTERARDRIQRLGPQLSAGQQPRVRRVVTFHPTADVMEMTVVVGFGKRVHALAVRLEWADGGQATRSGRWLCTTVEAA